MQFAVDAEAQLVIGRFSTPSCQLLNAIEVKLPVGREVPI